MDSEMLKNAKKSINFDSKSWKNRVEYHLNVGTGPGMPSCSYATDTGHSKNITKVQ